MNVTIYSYVHIFKGLLTPVSIYGVREDLMDYKTFSCEEPSCVPVQCQLLWSAEKQMEGWLDGNCLFSDGGNPFWNGLSGWPTLADAHVLQYDCHCICTHGLGFVSPRTMFAATLIHWAYMSIPYNKSSADVNWL